MIAGLVNLMRCSNKNSSNNKNPVKISWPCLYFLQLSCACMCVSQFYHEHRKRDHFKAGLKWSFDGLGVRKFRVIYALYEP